MAEAAELAASGGAAPGRPGAEELAEGGHLLVRLDGGDGFLAALAGLHVRARTPLDWSAWTAGEPIDLPTYPFAHRRYWPDAEPPAGPHEDGTTGGAAAGELTPSRR
ncbi:hypothetical protein BJF79_43655 [Actinomadura sp. CNU-125]|uniref:hypothetical protein n=1 Tax=Actinomadura sp. CNU-125 TaxID=1904961 RepID=UPI00095A8531|nr:hypothetical protein [Actinomadura sp. CNU-125]OLT26336.1 hypothetical protein BJF79_43655 [Actinomadura sp. CNU-125]